MEAVHNFEGVLLACLMLAFEETTAAGGGTYEKIKVSSSEGMDYCVVYRWPDFEAAVLINGVRTR
jgi:hypothetical protein